MPGLLLRGVAGSRSAFAIPFALGTVSAQFDVPFDVLGGSMVVTREVRFDVAGPVGLSIATPFNVDGLLALRVGVPFDVLDGGVGLDDFGLPLVPALGWYEAD